MLRNIPSSFCCCCSKLSLENVAVQQQSSLLGSYSGTYANSNFVIFRVALCHAMPPSRKMKLWLEYACKFYGWSWEETHIIFTHIPLARTQWHGHTSLPGSLGNLVSSRVATIQLSYYGRRGWWMLVTTIRLPHTKKGKFFSIWHFFKLGILIPHFWS